MRSVADLSRRLKRPAIAAHLPTILIMTDESRMPDPVAIVSRVPANGAIVFRHYDAPERYRLAVALATACRRAKIPLLVAGNAKLAHTLGVNGLHLPEWSIRRSQYWHQWRRPGWIVTAAAHSPAAIRRAALAGVDAVLVSPVFPTPSHPQARALGAMRLARWVRAAPVPVYALGGVDRKSAQRLTCIPLAGWSGISGMLQPLPENRLLSGHRRDSHPPLQAS